MTDTVFSVSQPETSQPPSPTLSNDLEEIVLGPQDIGGRPAAWAHLAGKAADPNPFFAPDFLVPFLDHMGHKNVRLIAIRSRATGHWLMAAPLVRRTLGLCIPAAATLATEYGPLGPPLMVSDIPVSVAETFLRLAVRVAGVPLIAIPYLPLEGKTAAALTKTPGWHITIHQTAARAVHDDGKEGEEQFAKAYSGKRRKELSRLIRRLQDHGTVRFESFQGAEVSAKFETFLQLEASGWKGAGNSALLSDPRRAAFARTMIANRAATGGVRLDTLTVAGRPVAMLVILIEAGRAFSWKIAYDEEYARYSPGTQITLFAFERNLSNPHVKGADSLAIPGHPMIDSLWRGRMRYGTLLCAGSRSGRLLQKAAGADIALERRLRDMAKKALRRVRF